RSRPLLASCPTVHSNVLGLSTGLNGVGSSTRRDRRCAPTMLLARHSGTLTEVHDPGAAPHSLNPHIRPREIIGGDLRFGDDHLSRERFVIGVAGAVEVGLE